MITFAYPWILLLLGSLPFIIKLRKRGWGKPASLIYPEAKSVGEVFKGGRRQGSGILEILRLITIGLLIIAAARPQQAHSVQYQFTKGLDMILALDISGSMLARDFEPLNRLQAAKTVIKEFVAKEVNNRLGLIAFAANAYTVCPLTLDYHILLNLLQHLSIGMTTDGTAIGMAIASAVNRLKASPAKAKVIIVLTDGRNNIGQIDPLTAADIAAALGIRIYTIGMGKPGGAPIVVQDATHGERILKTAEGEIYLEDIDEDTLQQVAEKTKGEYFRATDKKKLKAIYSQINELENTRIKTKQYRSKQDIGRFFIMLAFLCFLGEIILANTIEKRVP